VSALFGIRRFDERPVSADLAAMDTSLIQRGPDASHSWKQDWVGLGHRMLRTTPASLRECLPLVDADAGFVLAADARIDNRRELISLLGLDSHDDEDIGDGALILAAFKRWGQQAPEHLIGDFAFAIWDSGARTMFCARDPLGIRPFYYSHTPEKVFAFASTIQAVLACEDVQRRLNEVKIADHLMRRFEDTTSTCYRDVVRLPAAHSLTIGPRTMQLRRYWSLDCARELRLASDEEYADAFRERFLEAVRCRVRSAFPVGSTLSGGLDSSSIACAANSLLPHGQRPLRTFSAVFPSLPEQELRRIDERSYIDAVLRSAPFDPTYIYADRSSPLADWQSISQVFGDACVAPNLYIHWGMYRAAAAKGVRVLLDGLDGDTTVSHGLNHLTDLVRAGRWLRFGREASAVSRTMNYPFRSLVWQVGVRPLVPERFVQTWRRMKTGRAQANDETVLSRRLMEQVRSDSQAHEADDRRLLTHARRNHWLALNSPLIPYALEFADGASGSFAIEVRYPFFDRRLIEFCLSIPGDQKLRHGWTRSIMRRALDGILPAPIQWRPNKADLSPNFARALFERDRKTLQDVVLSRLERFQDYVNADAVRTAYGRWSREPRRHGMDGLTLFAIATLAFWFDTARIEG
jgi:asparagine synthase (glutamine-hydrolysing)